LQDLTPGDDLREDLVSDDLRKEYIKTLLSLLEEDKKSVLLYVAFDLAVVSLTLSEKLLQGPTSKSPFVAAGLCLLLASAAMFFNYYRKLHLSTFRLADVLLTLDTAAARQIPEQVWREHKPGYRVGYVVRLLGLAVLIATYLYPG